jgi:transcriptional regulator with XRE-family HTH domain
MSSIKNARLERGWSQTELSRKTGKSVTTLSNIENRRVTPTLDTLQCISRALNLPLEELAKDYSIEKGAVTA